MTNNLVKKSLNAIINTKASIVFIAFAHHVTLTITKGIKMRSKHGVLESAVLKTLWELEREGIYTNSVKDVYDILAQDDGQTRAYTTIKTVMDRLHEKKILLRFKQGKKFFYRTMYSNQEIIVESLNEIAQRYCNNDLIKLAQVLNIMIQSGEESLISA